MSVIHFKSFPCSAFDFFFPSSLFFSFHNNTTWPSVILNLISIHRGARFTGWPLCVLDLCFIFDLCVGLLAGLPFQTFANLQTDETGHRRRHCISHLKLITFQNDLIPSKASLVLLTPYSSLINDCDKLIQIENGEGKGHLWALPVDRK